MKTTFLLTTLCGVLLFHNSLYSQSMTIFVKGKVGIFIVDPLGRKSGLDKQTGIEYDEIPGAGFGSSMIGFNNSETGETTIDSAMIDLVDGSIHPALNGEYRFILQGISNSETHITTMIDFSDQGMKKTTKRSIIDNNMTVKIDLSFVDNNREQTYLKKFIDQEYLVKSLYAMRNRGWIKNDAARDKYISRINTYCYFVANNFTAWAQLELDSIQQELKADNLSQLIKKDVLNYLPDDVTQLKSELPPLTKESITVLLDTLINRTNTALMQNWLGNAAFTKELINHLENAKKHLNKKDSLKCAQEVEKFQSKVDKEYKDKGGKGSRFVTVEGWKFLYYNAQYIIERLVKLPAKSQGTLLLQIDELKSELTHQSNKKNIGGVLLVKSLTFLADQGKKQLQKPLPSTNDSATAALSIAAFQLFVDEVWELTGALSGKSKKLPALYVYDEAYIQLHYRAKYILEALPAPRTLIDMKSVEMDDDVRKELDAMRQMKKEQ